MSPDPSSTIEVPLGTGTDAFRPQAAVALHHQIKEDVFLRLRSGRWPPGFEARHLDVPPRTPLFQIERTTYSTADLIAEYRRALLRGDVYRYRIELR